MNGKIDIGGYLRAKAAGNAKVVKFEGIPFLIQTRFDPATGEKTEPQHQAFTPQAIEQVEKQAKDLEEQAADLKGFVEDLKNAKDAIVD